MTTLRNHHTRLELRFQELARQREGNFVFVLEHGLSADEIANLKEILRKEIRLNDGHITGCFQTAYFPFLVVATETGYDYAGNGTEFWPKFEKDLRCVPLSLSERQIISNWFEYASSRFSVAKPLDTPWSRGFRHIAWPITNSVLARDIRLPLLEALSTMPIQYYDRSPEDIAKFLRVYSQSQPYRRYRNWLQAMPVIGHLAQALITDLDTTPFLTPETLERIRRDIEQDKSDGVKLAQLRNKIKRNYQESQRLGAVQDTTPRVHVPRPKPTLFCRLFLQQKENLEWNLVGRLPKEVVDEIRQDATFTKILRSGYLRPLGWEAVSLPPPVFLQRQWFTIAPKDWGVIARKFLDLPNSSCSEKTAEKLDSIVYKFECSTLFEPTAEMDESGGCLYRPVSSISPNSGHVVGVQRKETSDWDDPEGIIIDEHSPDSFRIFHLDTSNSAALEWAAGKGIPIVKAKSWRWIAPHGQVDDERKQIIVSEGCGCFLSIDTANSVFVAYGNEEGFSATGIVVFEDLVEGIHPVTIGDERWSIDVVTTTRHAAQLFHATLYGEPIVDSLRNRLLKLEIDSVHPFVNVGYTLTLARSDSDENISYKKYSETLPTRVSLFPQAFSEKESEVKSGFWSLLRSQQDLKLTLEIEDVFKEEWSLESVNDGIWWENCDTDHPTAVSDGEIIETEEILQKIGRNSYYPDGFRLFQVVDASHEPLYRASTVLKYPQNEFSLGVQVLNLPERKLRQESDLKNGVGLSRIVEDILAFQQIQSRGFLDDVYRNQILNDLKTAFWTITCGERWTERMKIVDQIDIKAYRPSLSNRGTVC